MPAIAATAPALIAGGCATPLSTLDPAGPAAAGVATLWWVMLAGAGALFALVAVLIALAFRRRGAVREPVWLGWLGLAMPAAVLTALLGYAIVIGRATLATPVAGVVTVEATGHQSYWTFRQPGGIATRGVLHIPAGRPIDVRIASADVIHSFWVPRLAGKMDAIPGQVNVLRIAASRPGLYEGHCAEYCGIGHAGNRFRVVAHDAAGWAAFIGGGR